MTRILCSSRLLLEGWVVLVTGWYVGEEPFPIKRMQSSVCGMWEGSEGGLPQASCFPVPSIAS